MEEDTEDALEILLEKLEDVAEDSTDDDDAARSLAPATPLLTATPTELFM